jgi:urease accessory protein
MLHLSEIIPRPEAARPVAATVTLTLDERRKSRLRVALDDGREAAILLPRGSALHDGDRLRDADTGQIVAVRAAAESLSLARTNDPHLLLRGAYHLGNRHVPVELGDGWLAYEHDHVLDDMVRGLGLVVERRTGPFEPEGGAFRHEGHSHEGHSHEGGHGHAHDHPPDHDDGGHDHDHAHDHLGGSHHRHP